MNRHLGSIQTKYTSDNCHTVQINGTEFSIPRNLVSFGERNPDRWFAAAHKKHGVHEPGLAGTINFFSKHLDSEAVDFYDIGALFGYFSVLAEACFPKAMIHAVEANPESCRVIRQIVNLEKLSSKIDVHQLLLGNFDQTREFYSRGMSFFTMPTSAAKDSDAVEIVKRIMANVSDGNGNLVKMKQSNFVDFIDRTHRPGTQLILKIDTEGSQADFLPTAAQYLINKRAIVLLEFDSLEKLAPYRVTNHQICLSFLSNGYRLFWLDHRKLHEQAVEVLESERNPDIERNSLGILLPSKLL